MFRDKVKELEQENLSLKLQLEQLQMICGNTVDVPKNCEYCSNFIQHYVRYGGAYYPAYDGHCVAGHRTKRKSAGETCKAFAKRSYGKNNF